MFSTLPFPLINFHYKSGTMENYNQPSQKDENRQSSTSQNQNPSDPNRQQYDEQERNVGTTGYGTTQQSGNDRNYTDGSTQRPNQYSSSPEEDELDEEVEDDEMEDNDTGMDGTDDLDDDDERDSSATRQRDSDYDNTESTF